MEIVLVNTAMPFGPDTMSKATLGGSETAVLMVAKEMRKLGHTVNVFTPLPPFGRADHIDSGYIDEDGVRYIDYQNYANFIGNTEVDLLIVCRDPRAIATTSHAKKRVLWMHDIATHRGIQTALDQMAWTFDEIWTVSEFHRQQVHEVTGYPLKNIVAMRNGIVRVDDIVEPPFRLNKTLVYAARPERGLENLIKEGGIMEHLPDYTLKLAFYENTHEQMRNFYTWCNDRISKLPNVEEARPLPQTVMRQWLTDSSAYIYPTQFEETSCILARECIERGTPFLTTRYGALPETLGNCGLYFEDYVADHRPAGQPEQGTREWCKLFAEFVRFCLETEAGSSAVHASQSHMADRSDLYWDGVAASMIAHAEPAPVTEFSRAYSLVMDGDVVAAKAFLKDVSQKRELNWAENKLWQELNTYYPFLLDESDALYESLDSYYKRFYAFKDHELSIDQGAIDRQYYSPRFQQFSDELSMLPDGSTVLEYGCGEGHVTVPLAIRFPKLNFIAFDQVQSNVDHILKDYPGCPLPNVKAHRVSSPNECRQYLDGDVDAAICAEVLEHCVCPWEVAQDIEKLVKLGGRFIINTPFGPWEPQTFKEKPEEYGWRNHIWHFDKDTIRHVFRGKPNMTLACVGQGVMADDGTCIGNYLYAFNVDHEPLNPIDPLQKALAHRSRQTVGTAVIAYNNADTILRMLNSLHRKVQIVQIAAGPCTDATYRVIDEWAQSHPDIYVRILDVPKIAAPKEYGGSADVGFGFDDARNESVKGLNEIADWTLWIDTDEYLSGNLGIYLRNNCHDGYLISQHHFTVEPRGGTTQIDRPARLFRNSAGYKAIGHIHEHFEIAEGGPGHCFLLPDVDIGHTGYVNEEKRRERFHRNYPFLVWEHHEMPGRKLHAFLWFRDIVHRMRYAVFGNQHEAARDIAEEAEEWFSIHKKDMANFGAGLPTALQYISEVRRILGKGVPLEVGFKFDDRQAGLQALFLDRDELYEIMDTALEGEFKRRTSRYY